MAQYQRNICKHATSYGSGGYLITICMNEQIMFTAKNEESFEYSSFLMFI